MTFTIKVNGVDRIADVDGDTPLLWVLRDVFGMTGTKFGCGVALCGACTVHLDGTPTRSCITTIDSVSSAAVTTIEAIGTPRRVKRSKRPGSIWKSFSVAIASPGKLYPHPHCWRAIHTRAMPTFATGAGRGAPELVVFHAGNNWRIDFREVTAEIFEDFWRVGCPAGFLVACEAAKRLVPLGRETVIFTGTSGSTRGKAGYAHFAAGKLPSG
jgi:hypothetical protein